MNIYSPKDGQEVYVAWVQELIPGSPEGVCMIDKEPHINSICNIGYVCDACPYNPKYIQEWW